MVQARKQWRLEEVTMQKEVTAAAPVASAGRSKRERKPTQKVLEAMQGVAAEEDNNHEAPHERRASKRRRP